MQKTDWMSLDGMVYLPTYLKDTKAFITEIDFQIDAITWKNYH